jgi:hypothetical protein
MVMKNRTERIEVLIGGDEYWHDKMTGPETDELTLGESIELHGDDLAEKVVLGQISVKHLRQSVKLLNRLEGEVNILLRPYGDELSALDLEERLEADCRWFAHHVCKHALAQVNSSSQRINLRDKIKRAKTFKASQMPGMGRLELHDIRALREEAEQVE